MRGARRAILVAHPGAHVGSGIENGIKTIAKSIDEAHSRMQRVSR